MATDFGLHSHKKKASFAVIPKFHAHGFGWLKQKFRRDKGTVKKEPKPNNKINTIFLK